MASLAHEQRVVPIRGVPNDTPDTSATFTLLFTDMEGSTARWEADLDAADVVERHFAVLRDAVDGEGGTIFATLGDGVAASFTSAAAAVRAAVDAQRRFVEQGVGVRMGLHTGEVLVVDDDLRGRALNRAARIAAVGHGGQILVSSVTAHLLRTGPEPVELLNLGSHRLRDLSEPERIFQIVDPALARELPPLRSLDAHANNLPIRRSELVGRERDIGNVVASIDEHRVVTLIGPGGVGKTRVALHAAGERSTAQEGSWFVNLAAVDAGDDLLRAISVAVGADPAAGAIDGLRAAVGARPALLVLDNCEHVIDGVAAAVDALTDACDELKVLATSREPIGIDGEYVIPIRPLDPDGDALELFELRARAVGAPITPEHRDLARQICQRLDGLPLAIELAAARVPTIGLQAILDALDDRFWLLSGGRRGKGDRHATMRATVGWSYHLLEPEEQRMLEWLAVFPGGFELDAVRHVGAVHGLDPGAAPDVIGSLVRRSMVEADISAPIVRYHLLETVRAFALEALHERGETARATQVHAEWVAGITDLPNDEPCSAQVERHAIRLEREAENWRKAVLTAARLGSSDLARRLCGPPTSLFLLSRVDLADALAPLLEIPHDNTARHSIVRAIAVACAGGADPRNVRVWSDELAALEPDPPTGASHLVEWMARNWEGRVDDAVELAISAVDDPRLATDTRDMFLGLAMTECFSRPDHGLDAEALTERAIEVSRRTDAGVQRVTCLLGAAWAVHQRDPAWAVSLVHDACLAMPCLPRSLQRTLPGNAARLLAAFDTRSAARHLLDCLDERKTPTTHADLIPAFYATELLHRLGDPAAGPALATLAASPLASYLALRNFQGVANEAAKHHQPISLHELIPRLRAALEVIAAADEPVLTG